MADNKTMWQTLCEQAQEFAQAEPRLSALLDQKILHHQRLGECLVELVADCLSDQHLSKPFLIETFQSHMSLEIEEQAIADLIAIRKRDPACNYFLQAVLNFKGFKALTAYRFAHALWQHGQPMTALILQGRMSDLWDIDIHPAAQIGCGLMVDHASGVVIGETTVVENDVSMFHGVTLGGTGKERGDRHPKVRKGAFIGTGAAILGNIEVGEQASIAAGSMVLKPVPAHAIAAGVPARIIQRARASAAN